MLNCFYSVLADLSNDREKSKLANQMKMIVYLLCQLVELIEADVIQKDSASAATKVKNAKKKATLDESWSWEGRRNEAITLAFRLLSLNINSLFDPPLVEEELINLIGNLVFRIFENPGIALQRLKDTRMGLSQILGVMITKYGYSLSCRLKIVQSLKHFEHLAVSVERISP